MTILGIDPGTRACGYAIISVVGRKLDLVEAGFIRIKSRVLQEQIAEMVEGFDLIISKHVIDEVAIGYVLCTQPKDSD